MSDERATEADIRSALDAVTDEGWSALGEVVEAWRAAEPQPGAAEATIEDRDGVTVIVSGGYRYPVEVSAIVDHLYELGLVVPFDWASWIASFNEDERIDSPEVAVRYLTAAIRSERFSEGSIEAAITSGWFDDALEELLVFGGVADETDDGNYAAPWRERKGITTCPKCGSADLVPVCFGLVAPRLPPAPPLPRGLHVGCIIGSDEPNQWCERCDTVIWCDGEARARAAWRPTMEDEPTSAVPERTVRTVEGARAPTTDRAPPRDARVGTVAPAPRLLPPCDQLGGGRAVGVQRLRAGDVERLAEPGVGAVRTVV